VFLFAASSECRALELIAIVTPDRARELGLEIRSHPAGPDAVTVELAFDVKGELQNYRRVELEIRDGKKLLLSSTLREERPKPGRVVVSFYADRGHLDNVTLKVVTENSPLERVGHVVRVGEFVGVGKGG
jgi:hypothetical protein